MKAKKSPTQYIKTSNHAEKGEKGSMRKTDSHRASMMSLDKEDKFDKTKSVGFANLTGQQMEALKSSYAQFQEDERQKYTNLLK